MQNSRKAKSLKVAVIYNEPSPETYVKAEEMKEKPLNFTPYFEVEDLTPIEEYELLAGELNKAGCSAYTVNIKDDLWKLIDNIEKKKPDVVFNFVELYKENSRLEMNIAGVYELLNVPYTGAAPLTLANCQSKILTKRILNARGVKTAKFIVLKKRSEKYSHKLKYPLIVKPAFEDASVGIENDSIVRNQEELKKRVDYVFRYFGKNVLVEEFIEGRELNVALLGDRKPKVLPISEIDFSKMPDHLHNIVSYQAKWDPKHEAYHKTIPKCPAKLLKKAEKEIKEVALRAFKAMECRDYARVDIRLSKENEVFVLEVNPNPDLTEGAGFMRSAETVGYSYSQALKKIVDLAYKRSAKKKKPHLQKN